VWCLKTGSFETLSAASETLEKKENEEDTGKRKVAESEPAPEKKRTTKAEEKSTGITNSSKAPARAQVSLSHKTKYEEDDDSDSTFFWDDFDEDKQPL
jgi:hypothetical protein